MSNPARLKASPIVHRIGSKTISSRIATQVARGAKPIEKPKMKWQSQVNLFEKEYPKRIIRVGKESRQVMGLMNQLAIKNPKEDKTTNNIAERFEIFPAGISRFLVRSFCESMSVSTIRLKPIAADLAKTIESKIRIERIVQSKTDFPCVFKKARINAIPAKGRANSV